MTTQKIANRLVELCKKGKYQQCYQELYSPEIQSVEADGTTAVGFAALAKKGKEWNAGIKQFHSSSIGAPQVNGNWFTLPMSMKLTYKGQKKPTEFKEICVYQVKDSKVVKEQFFYDN